MHDDSFPVERPALYVVATPIGNLGDISQRALAILRRVDWIAAEDTRVSGQLLRHFGIDARLLSLREHNEASASAAIIERLRAGQAVAQVSDAGTPAVSDPGARLVAAVHAAGFKVIPLPGASATLAALAAAGMRSPRFLFHGFPEPKSAARREEFSRLAQLDCSLVLFEAPHRIEESLADMAAVFGPAREAVLARELTKTFETIRRATLGELLEWVKSDPNQRRGELVVLIEAAPPVEDEDLAVHDKVLLPLLRELPVKQAVKLAIEISGASRNALYQRALALKAENEGDDA
ncbi:16S rRNA (cytidine(1402)-2'-O)-methyltransferase [Chitinimonas lacunae]|uniref:Ribosomal RNA small subunit methyltransferase I n=1 Tax=Chitinimonas lacunae TaxID=1963018 RepID=A0ABV8MM26_9NEIS